jgi:hypothetical protein
LDIPDRRPCIRSKRHVNNILQLNRVWSYGTDVGYTVKDASTN